MLVLERDFCKAYTPLAARTNESATGWLLMSEVTPEKALSTHLTSRSGECAVCGLTGWYSFFTSARIGLQRWRAHCFFELLV